MYTLYGDGVHDDAPAIQELLDSGISAVILPTPAKNYAIGSTLVIHSGQSLTLPETAVIRLLPGSNCFMLINERGGDHDISVSGGIWDFNNQQQHPHPRWVPADIQVKTPDFFPADHPKAAVATNYPDRYRGRIMRFFGVTRLSIHDLTCKDPIQYAIEMGWTEYFTVENIRFDFNYGNPYPFNMDGVHIDGGCRFGHVRNIQGTCYDDVVAINADDGLTGPISDIEVDGIFGTDSLRGVRLLSTHSPVERISISNIFGTFYQNAVGLTFYYQNETTRGIMNHISLHNIFASNAPRLPIYQKSINYQFALIDIDRQLDIGMLTIENVGRDEKLGDIETLRIREGTVIRKLSLAHISHENHTGKPVPVITNDGCIDTLYLLDVDGHGDTILSGSGTIRAIRDLG